MESDSIAKLLPRLIFPHAQDWAERAGHTFLSKILVDDKFRLLVERIGEELESRARSPKGRSLNGHSNQSKRKSSSKRPESDSHSSDLEAMQERLSTLESQYELQQAIFETVRKKIRPLALALGSCPECLVGVELCAKCAGHGKVGAYPPDYAMLSEEIIAPLVAQGTPLSLRVKKESKSTRLTRKPATYHKENGHVSSNGQHSVGE